MQYMAHPFRLYAVSNCPYCQQARDFMFNAGIIGELVFADNDPIILEGITKLTGQDRFPVLLSRLTNEIITGWRPEEYERLRKVYDALYRPSTSGLSVDGKPASQENSTPSSVDSSGTS